MEDQIGVILDGSIIIEANPSLNLVYDPVSRSYYAVESSPAIPQITNSNRKNLKTSSSSKKRISQIVEAILFLPKTFK